MIVGKFPLARGQQPSDPCQIPPVILAIVVQSVGRVEQLLDAFRLTARQAKLLLPTHPIVPVVPAPGGTERRDQSAMLAEIDDSGNAASPTDNRRFPTHAAG